MSNDPFERWDAGPDPDYEARSRQIIDALSNLVPWDGDDKAFNEGVRTLIKKVRERAPDLVSAAQVVGAFRWWAAQPVGNDGWRARVGTVVETLSRELLERHA